MSNETTHLLSSAKGDITDQSCIDEEKIAVKDINLLPSAASTSGPTPKGNDVYGTVLAPYCDIPGRNLDSRPPPRISSGASMDISIKGYDSEDSTPAAELVLKKQRKKKMIALVSCLLALGVAVVIAVSMIKAKEDEFPSQKPIIKAPEIKVKETVGPLSNLHPSRDLNVLPYDRGFATQLHVQINGESSPEGTQLKSRQSKSGRLPTNAWYENLLLYTTGRTQPGAEQRVYSMPYIIDATGPIPGLRLHQSNRQGGNLVIQMIVDESTSLTLGMNKDLAAKDSQASLSHMYELDDSEGAAHSALSLNLRWNGNSGRGYSQDSSVGSVTKMESSIVRGMPYATMKYFFSSNVGVRDINAHTDTVLPTIFSQFAVMSDPIRDDDRDKPMKCDGSAANSTVYRVEKEIEMSFVGSDFTWLAFFSHPVYVRCSQEGGTQFQVVDLPKYPGPARDKDGSPIIYIRLALANKCTTGANRVFCKSKQPTDQGTFEGYKALLRHHKNVFPGKNVRMDLNFESSEDVHHQGSVKRETADLSSAYSRPAVTNIEFNWDPQNMYSTDNDETGVLMFALPHHFEQMTPSSGSRAGGDSFCDMSLIGPVCPVGSSKWILVEKLETLSFRAPRPPSHEAIPDLVKALNKDIFYRAPEYFMKGVGDTYFSGKILAKIGRILLINEELRELQDRTWIQPVIPIHNDADRQKVRDVAEEARRSSNALRGLKLPDDEAVTATIDHLRSGVEIWLNGTAGAPFVYDTYWGGMVNCGCMFNQKTWTCNNHFPNCPAFADAGLNFGNGFYNDHHFHYGYHIFAAAVVAHFDPVWGKKFYDEVLLLVRDIANPSRDDDSFPTFRHKDWYQGNSWASGIVIPPLLNGRNQESSSEAIAAYESVGLYGEVMAKLWGESEVYVEENYLSALRVRDVGRLLTSTELRAADRYWHVKKGGKVYPSNYAQAAIGMMWSTMAQFQTFFGGKPFLAYGIQLLPLTPIAEERDSYNWIKTLYPTFAQTCEADSSCVEQGWSILQYAVLATIGHKDEALKEALKIPPAAYESAGGNGHSESNTIWYISTRPNNPPAPTELPPSQRVPDGPPGAAAAAAAAPPPPLKITCGCEKSCTPDALATMAGSYSCESRIKWLITAKGETEQNACLQIAHKEHPDDCGKCDPSASACDSIKEETSREEKRVPTLHHRPGLTCGCEKTCTPEVLATDAAGYSCKSRIQWLMHARGESELNACLEIAHKEHPDDCGKCDPSKCGTEKVKKEAALAAKKAEELSKLCPPCKSSVCKKAGCSVNAAPYLCTVGGSVGGCSAAPWDDTTDCQGCCKVTNACRED